MDEREMLLVLTICDLLGRSFKAAQIEQAFERAKKQLGRPSQPPREAKKTYARRRYETE